MSGEPLLTKRIDYPNLNSITLCYSRYKKLHRSERQALLQCLVLSQALITLSSHHWGKYSELNSFLLDLFQSLPPSELSVPRTECSNALCLTKCTQTITKGLGWSQQEQHIRVTFALFQLCISWTHPPRPAPLVWCPSCADTLSLSLPLSTTRLPHPLSRPHTSCGHQKVNTCEQTVHCCHTCPQQ